MVNEAKSRQFTGLPAADALFLGTAVLEHAGYQPFSPSQPPSETFQKACSEDRLEPGLIHYMVVCLPFRYIYTHGDCGLIAKANKTVNKDAGPTVVPVAEKEPVSIEYLSPYWQQMMLKSPAPTYDSYHPQKLVIASIKKDYDTEILDKFLSQCKSSSQDFQAFLLAGEPLERSMVKKHRVKRLKITWRDYLDSEGFQEYYRQGLVRLFKEYRTRSLVRDFVGRNRELAHLHKALQEVPFIQVVGDVGSGKTTFLKKPDAKKEEPKESKTPSSDDIPSFSFEPEEKAWLTSFNGEKLAWSGSRKWAGFGMLYTLYYLKGELSSVADLGYIPSLQGEYHRLFTTINDLYLMARKAASKTPIPVQWQWKDEWFHQEKNSLDLLVYYDNQMLRHSPNPVCAAFLCQALDAYSWHNIAAEFKQEALQWINTDKDQWEPFMTGRSIDLFSPRGKEAFLAFLEEQKKKQEDAPGTEPITEKAMDGFLGRFSVTWERMTGYFQELFWRQLTAEEENIALSKLLFLIEKLKTILKNIMEQANSAPDDLKLFLEEISIPAAFMRRLAHYIAEKDKPEPMPLYVSGEILAIKAGTLAVTIEISGEEDRELEIPIADFPAENPQVGQRFFAKINEEHPDTVYDIKPMKMREKRTFDEIFIDLFGKDIYDKVVSQGQGEEKSS